MKKILANTTRLTIKYSKFLLMIMVLSFSGTGVRASDIYTYLNCGIKYLRLSGVYIDTNYNIRTKRFLESYSIEKYGEKWIKAKRGYSTIWLNRDTGEMSYGRGSDSKKYPCKVINNTELPSTSDEGKKF